MKKLLTTIAIVATLFLNACATTGWLQSTYDKYLKQAFGDALRSLEGSATLDQIPSLIVVARNKWLPAGHQWDVFVANLISKYVVAHPTNNAEMNHLLEQLALDLQK